MIGAKCDAQILITVIHKDECRHMGFDHVFQSIWKRFFWTGMVEDIREWLRVCAMYQCCKPRCGRGAAMDLAVLPYTHNGYSYILVYQDYYRKFIKYLPLKEKTAKAVFTRDGVVRDRHADQGIY